MPTAATAFMGFREVGGGVDGERAAPPGADLGHDLLGRLGDDEVRPGREMHDGVGVGLDAHDQVRVEVEGLEARAPGDAAGSSGGLALEVDQVLEHLVGRSR